MDGISTLLWITHPPTPTTLGFVATHGAKLQAIVQDIANDDDANPAFPLGAGCAWVND